MTPPLDPEQIKWVLDNLKWFAPVVMFVFVSLVFGFWKLIYKLWKLIGKLFCKIKTPKDIPQEKVELLPSQPLEEKITKVLQESPVVEDKYLDLTK